MSEPGMSASGQFSLKTANTHQLIINWLQFSYHFIGKKWKKKSEKFEFSEFLLWLVLAKTSNFWEQIKQTMVKSKNLDTDVPIFLQMELIQFRTIC